MRRIFDTRLARIVRAETPRDMTQARRRALLRARAAVVALLRKWLGQPDSGRAFAGALEIGETAAAELARIPDAPDLRQIDEARLARDCPGMEEAFEARLLGVVQQYRDGRELDPANASPAELLGACLTGPPPAEAAAAPPLTLPLRGPHSLRAGGERVAGG